MRDPSEKVVVGYLTPGHVHSAFAESLLDLLVYDVAYHQRIVNGGGRLAIQAGANLSAPRNSLVRKFLAYGKADWLFMVDSDMTFAPDTVERLLEFADPDPDSEHFAPIVGGLCFGFDDKAHIQPTLFGLMGDEAEPQVVRYHEWKPNAMMQVAATGTACLLIHKSVFRKIQDVQLPQRKGRPGFNDAFPWFQETEHGGTPVSEDITFCWRAGLLGLPVFVNTGVRIGHMKDRELNMDAYLAQRAALEDASSAAVFRDVEAEEIVR